MKLKSLKIHIQHAPIAGDPKEWVMDFRAEFEDGSHKESSWNAFSEHDLIASIPDVLKKESKTA